MKRETASEDKANRKPVEVLSSLSSFVCGLKSQLGKDNKTALFLMIKEAMEWTPPSPPNIVSQKAL